MGKKLGVISLGCSKNLVDTEMMIGILKAGGYEFIDELSDAEVIIVNTCTFIDSAKEESIEAILKAAAYKESGKCEKLVVAGIHYTLTSLSKDEWMQTDRLKNVTKYLSCQEGQEVSETLDVETVDEVTGEALYGTIGRIELKEDGADWKEGALEEWDIYSWNGESWVYQRNDECFYATEESPWFEGYEACLYQTHMYKFPSRYHPHLTD